MKATLLSFVIALAGFASMVVLAQQDDDVRGAFMTTRPKPTGKVTGENSSAPRPSHRRPKPVTVVKNDDKKKPAPARKAASRAGVGAGKKATKS